MSKRPTKTNDNLRGENKAIKVVHIKTQYVETDAVSFKSVVQNLTGKYSTIPESPPHHSSSPLAMKVKSRSQNRVLDGGGCSGGGGGGGGSGGSCKFLSRDLSFDRMCKEFPSIDELHKLLTFD
ncbi:hypothetical protein RND81_09G139100 [Saponaria officinalis]|uniref:VQ domain-containing protein n=1 Tax=Saponaria officinalis TaxID=3572 RepID=A0AAW1IMJ8_SAPOF